MFYPSVRKFWAFVRRFYPSVRKFWAFVRRFTRPGKEVQQIATNYRLLIVLRVDGNTQCRERYPAASPSKRRHPAVGRFEANTQRCMRSFIPWAYARGYSYSTTWRLCSGAKNTASQHWTNYLLTACRNTNRCHATCRSTYSLLIHGFLQSLSHSSTACKAVVQTNRH